MQKHILMFGAFILLMAGCSTIQVTSDYEINRLILRNTKPTLITAGHITVTKF